MCSTSQFCLILALNFRRAPKTLILKDWGEKKCSRNGEAGKGDIQVTAAKNTVHLQKGDSE